MAIEVRIRLSLLSADKGTTPYVSGADDALGKWDMAHALPMRPCGDHQWELEITLPTDKPINYGIVQPVGSEHPTGRYKGIKRNFGSVAYEGRILIDELSTCDGFPQMDIAPTFADVICYHSPVKKYHTRISRKLILRTYAPHLTSHMQLCLLGDHCSLGAWEPQAALPMHFVGNGFWEICLDMDSLPDYIEYKFVSRKSLSNGTSCLFAWDKGYNRSLDVSALTAYQSYIQVGHVYEAECIEPARYAGTAIPLSSVRHAGDWGIGDFTALRKMVDWVSYTGQRVLQLLPLMDTTFTYGAQDAYPYSPVSMYALNPIYADLNELPPLKDKSLDARLRTQAQKLHGLARVDYALVLNLKNEFLYRHFLDINHQLVRHQGFKQFVKANEYWLLPYVTYCILRDRRKGIDPAHWGEYADYSREWAKDLLEDETYVEEANYYRYVQYLLDDQFVRVAQYARKKGIVLKGDIPVGVSPYSATAWAYRKYYNRDVSVGAPPDIFAIDGQNWGFPAINWDSKIGEDEDWVRNRFERMARFFSAIRIDHVLGFFRTWTIPIEQKSGLLGQFLPAKGFTAQEILSFGYPFDPEIDLHPMLDRAGLCSLFGENTEIVTRSCLVKIPGQDLYTPQDRLATQRLVGEVAMSLPGGLTTQEALERLLTEQPFVCDHSNPSIYHPRYMFEESRRFELMNPESQKAWRKLNHDYYNGRNDGLWFQQGRRKIEEILASTSMLVCVEDLGLIPPVLPSILASMPLLSLEIERMPKQYGTLYTDLHKINYLSVCATSTHDMSPLRLWWKQMTEQERQLYMEQVLHRTSTDWQNPDLNADLARQILSYHLLSPAMLAIFPLSDWMTVAGEFADVLPEEELINDPTDAANAWDYRMPCLVEDLMERHIATSLEIRKLVKSSGRYV